MGLFSYIWRYLDIALRIRTLVYFVVIFLASLLAVFVIAAMTSIHSFGIVSIIGGWGICICWWLHISLRIGCVCHCGSFFAICIVFLMRWYVARYFFHSLASFRGRKPPCCAGLFVRFGSGGALQVFLMVSEIHSTILSRDVQDISHWPSVRCSWLSNNCINSFILVEFPSKNSMLNYSKFSGGIGLSILVWISGSSLQ